MSVIAFVAGTNLETGIASCQQVHTLKRLVKEWQVKMCENAQRPNNM